MNLGSLVLEHLPRCTESVPSLSGPRKLSGEGLWVLKDAYEFVSCRQDVGKEEQRRRAGRWKESTTLGEQGEVKHLEWGEGRRD